MLSVLVLWLFLVGLWGIFTACKLRLPMPFYLVYEKIGILCHGWVHPSALFKDWLTNVQIAHIHYWKKHCHKNINWCYAYCMLGRWMQGLPLTFLKLMCWKFRPPASRCKVVDISCQVMINGSSFRLCPFVHFLQCTPSLALYCSTRLNSHKVTIETNVL